MSIDFGPTRGPVAEKASVKPSVLQGVEEVAAPPKRSVSEYKRQLVEKQRVKKSVYKMREKQFRRFFKIASAMKEGGVGDNLLACLERRLDNVIFRLKMALSRRHARQMVVHGHFFLNGKKVKSPSIMVKSGDQISFCLDNNDSLKESFSKKIHSNIKVPDWLELDGDKFSGKVLRMPLREDIPTKVDANLIVEHYSK